MRVGGHGHDHAGLEAGVPEAEHHGTDREADALSPRLPLWQTGS